MEESTKKAMSKRLMTGGVALAVVFGAAGVANAGTAEDDGNTDTTGQPAPVQDELDDELGEDEGLEEGDDDDSLEADDEYQAGDEYEEDDDHGERGESTEVELAGSDAEQATAAALAAVPGGTIDRLETDDDGAAFEAHMTDADGNRVTVKLDESFGLIEIEIEADGGGRGRGHHRDTPLDSAVGAQVIAAGEAAVPGGTVIKVEQEDDGYEAHVMGTDGIEVEVYFDADLAVVEIVPGD